MIKKIRYGDFISTISVQQRCISYNQLTPKPRFDEQGNELPYVQPRIRLRPREMLLMIMPYVESRLLEQIKTVLPLVLYLLLFQWLILQKDVQSLSVIAFGIAAVMLGLMLFIEGLQRGLMPFGEELGDTLPRRLRLSGVLFIAFLLGIGVTLAEPAIGALKTAGSLVSPIKAPLLYALLNQWSNVLVAVVGMGVGLAAVVATLRFVRGWGMKPLIYLTVIPVLGLSLYMQQDPILQAILGLAWDSGAVTTGPVTVPLVLALGIGVAAATSKQNAPSGFGIVTLASLFPIFGVLLLGLYVATFHPESLQIMQTASVAQNTPISAQQALWDAVLMGLRAIVPLIIFLLIVMKLILHRDLPNPKVLTYGLIVAVLGMIIFNIGLTFGLSELGGQAGQAIPFALDKGIGGYLLAFAFAWLLGFGATLAEPALHAMGITVENLTQGAFKRYGLIYAVSFGVAFGIMLGVIKLVFHLPLIYFILPGYAFALVLTFFAHEEYVNIAWDSAGVTTGPVTVPLVLAMGLGLGDKVGASDGFGILALASIGPIISVLCVGLWITWQVRRSHDKHEQEVAKNQESQQGATP